MAEEPQKDTTPVKKYSLTSEETKNLLGRDMALDYLTDLVGRDIGMYVNLDIKPRLGLSPDVPFALTKDRKVLEIEDKPKIIIPNGKKV